MRISDWSSDVCSSDLAPVLRRSAVMRKERRQHVGIFHHAKKLGMVAQFHEVIRGRCGGRGEPVRNGMDGLDQLGAVMTIGRFTVAAPIQNRLAELKPVEKVGNQAGRDRDWK